MLFSFLGLGFRFEKFQRAPERHKRHIGMALERLRVWLVPCVAAVACRGVLEKHGVQLMQVHKVIAAQNSSSAAAGPTALAAPARLAASVSSAAMLRAQRVIVSIIE